MQTTNNDYTHIKIITRTLCFFFVCIIARLFYLQINLAPYFISRSKKNFLRITPTHATRGNILDCNGTLLATNRPKINVWWTGTGKKNLTSEQKQLLIALEQILKIPLHTDPSWYKTIEQKERYKKK